MTSEIDDLDLEAVYTRTSVGQQALLVGAMNHTRNERRLLGVVTGLTPLSVLLDMGFSALDLREAVVTLTRLGLVERTGN